MRIVLYTEVDDQCVKLAPRSTRGSRILQERVSNPSERGTPIILTHVTGTKQFFWP